ncbi:MAG TPA: oligopeptide:H+ symporter [Gammaproteobacteria bacterium]|nr:oligopeptide:H+ symporter [Gammaproteobacteria bacterium]
MNATAAAAKPASASKTLGFVTLFLIEMWERFGYYGMTAVIVLYMVHQLGYSDDRANLTFGAFTAMAYAVPAVGGWIGDRILGSKRTTVLGATTLTIGYVLLSLPYQWLVFPALAIVAVGGGIFKANPANVISKLYQGESAKLDSAFTMYYMAVNLGATISQIATPLIQVYVGWHTAFAICAAGLVVGQINYHIMQRHLAHVGSEPDFQPVDVKKLLLVIGCMILGMVAVGFIIQNRELARGIVWAAGIAALAVFAWMWSIGNANEKKGVLAVFILTVQTVAFFIYYQQMSTSLTLFADRNVDLNFYGYMVPAGQVQALNPIWIFILSPPLAILYNYWGKSKGGDFHISTKFAMGFVILAAGFFIYGWSGHFAVAGKISLWWMIWGYCLQSLGELLISGLGLAMVARYVGPKMRGFVMGLWFLATGISQYLGGIVATYASVPDNVTDPVQSLPLYTKLCMELGYWALGFTVLAVAMIPVMKWISATGGEATDH